MGSDSTRPGSAILAWATAFVPRMSRILGLLIQRLVPQAQSTMFCVDYHRIILPHLPLFSKDSLSLLFSSSPWPSETGARSHPRLCLHPFLGQLIIQVC